MVLMARFYIDSFTTCFSSNYQTQLFIMKKAILLLAFLMTAVMINAQIVAVRSVVSNLGKDTLIGTTNWAYTVGQAVNDTYSVGNLTLTQGFNQPDGFYITPLIPYVSNLVIYPNPAKPNATLRFYLKADKPFLNIRIYDAAGRLYQSQTLESFAGQTWHSLNPQVMAAGTYQVKVTAGDENYSGRIVIVN